MEQDVKLGSVGEIKASESLAAEHAEVAVAFEKAIGPAKVKLQGVLSVDLDNASLLAMLADKVPGGFLHDGIKLLAKELGIVLPAVAAAAEAPAPEAAPAAPSA